MVAATVADVISEVVAVVICAASVVEDDVDESSSSSSPHAPSRRIPAATAAIDINGARRLRRDIADGVVASGPHARVTRAKLVQVDPKVQVALIIAQISASTAISSSFTSSTTFTFVA